MKRIITYVAAMTALVLAASCSRESMQDIQTGDGLSLQVMWTEMATRADEGEVNNEYAVNSLDMSGTSFPARPTAAPSSPTAGTSAGPMTAARCSSSRTFRLTR